jgi:orotidine-5'-phosphate decarboxylase
LKLGYASDLSYNIKELVGIRAELMVEAGVEGLVCSGKEISLLRHRFPQILLFVPGIRPLWSLVEGEDQSRVITPKDAMIQGSDYLVIGRPILKSPDPKEAAIKIIKEIEEGLSWRSKISTT